MDQATPRSAAVAFAVVACALDSAAGQQPQLALVERAFSQQSATASLSWGLYGRPGDLFVLLADLTAGQTSLFGRPFDLAFSPALQALGVGLLQASGTSGFLPLAPSALPAGVPVLLQFGEWDVAQGLGTLLVSNADSFVVHNSATAIVASFDSPGLGPFAMTGVYDRSVFYRLQALPPTVRQVRPLPPQAYPFPATSSFDPLHPAGSRFQLAFRAADLGANGLPEALTAVRWRPLFGAVTAQSHPQFELLAAHTAAVPDYSIDPWSALPVAPNSGLATTFASNPAGPSTTLYSGPYSVLPQSLLPSGYLPFPTPQQSFVYDGERTLLLETRCAPAPGAGTPQNHQLFYLLVPSSPNPFATVYASAGWNGQPSPLPPLAATTGTGGSFLFDWELEFVRSTSQATSAWLPSQLAAPDYQPATAIGFTPPGTTMQFEYRGADDAVGTGATAWSGSQDIADGKPFLQFRVRMTANVVTGAVPWLDTLVVPAQ